MANINLDTIFCKRLNGNHQFEDFRTDAFYGISESVNCKGLKDGKFYVTSVIDGVVVSVETFDAYMTRMHGSNITDVIATYGKEVSFGDGCSDCGSGWMDGIGSEKLVVTNYLPGESFNDTLAVGTFVPGDKILRLKLKDGSFEYQLMEAAPDAEELVNVLWLSRHPMTPTQQIELIEAFGPVNVILHTAAVASAAEVVELAKHCEHIMAVLPISILSELIFLLRKGSKKVFRAKMRREECGTRINTATGVEETDYAMYHDYFEVVEKVEVITSKLLK